MAKKGDPDVLRLVVVFLRFYAGLTQAELGLASGVHQTDISRYESGEEAPPEKILRRIAKAAKVPWYLAVLLRRFVEAFLVAAARRNVVTGPEPLAPEILAPVMLAITPYLIEEKARQQHSGTR